MAVSSHLSRWLVAALLIPILVAAVFFAPPLVFDLLVILIGSLALKEYSDLVKLETRPVYIVLVLLGLVLIVFGARTGSAGVHLASLGLALWLGFIYFLLTRQPSLSLINQLGGFSLGHVYISLFISCFVFLHGLERGAYWVFFVLAVTFLSDTSAFYTGRTVGRRPLYPRISPNKTVEGLAGGIIAGGIAALIAAPVLPAMPWYEALVLGLLMGLWGAVGDLFESMLKRSADVKDSGGLLMGHGGFLDRIDAVLFNAPLVYGYIQLKTIIAG